MSPGVNVAPEMCLPDELHGEFEFLWTCVAFAKAVGPVFGLRPN